MNNAFHPSTLSLLQKSKGWKISIAFFLLGTLMTIFFVTGFIELYGFHKHGKKTQATIEEKWKEAKEGDDGTLVISYYAAYTFNIKDFRDFGGEKELTHKEFKTIKAGDKIITTYLPNNPNINTPYKDKNLWTLDTLAGLAISIVFLVIGIAVIIYHYQKAKKNIFLYYNGNTVHGTITSIQEFSSSKGHLRKITYTYKNRKGKTHTRTTTPVQIHNQNHTHKTGDNIVIHCHPKHQKNSIWKEELY